MDHLSLLSSQLSSFLSSHLSPPSPLIAHRSTAQSTVSCPANLQVAPIYRTCESANFSCTARPVYLPALPEGQVRTPPHTHTHNTSSPLPSAPPRHRYPLPFASVLHHQPAPASCLTPPPSAPPYSRFGRTSSRWPTTPSQPAGPTSPSTVAGTPSRSLRGMSRRVISSPALTTRCPGTGPRRRRRRRRRRSKWSGWLILWRRRRRRRGALATSHDCLRVSQSTMRFRDPLPLTLAKPVSPQPAQRLHQDCLPAPVRHRAER